MTWWSWPAAPSLCPVTTASNRSASWSGAAGAASPSQTQRNPGRELFLVVEVMLEVMVIVMGEVVEVLVKIVIIESWWLSVLETKT